MPARTFLFKLVFLGLSVIAQGQVHYPDFLERNIQMSRKPHDKINWLCIAARYYMEPDEKKSQSLIDEAKQLAKGNTNLTLLVLLQNAERLQILFDHYYYISKSIQEAKNALTIAQSNRIKDMEAGAYLYLAEGYRFSGELGKSDSLIQLGLDIVLNPSDGHSFIFDSLAVECLVTQSRIQQEQRKLAQSLKSASDAYKMAKDMRNKYLEYLTEERMGSVYSSYGSQTNRADYKKARQYYRKATTLTNPRYHEYQLISGYVMVGGCYENENNTAFLDSAMENYRTALWLAERTDKNVRLPYIQLRVIECLVNMGRGDSAAYYLNLYQPDLHKYFQQVDLKERLFYRLGNIYKKLGLYYYSDKKDKWEAKKYLDSSLLYFKDAFDYYNNKATLAARTFFYIDYGIASWNFSMLKTILGQEDYSSYNNFYRDTIYRDWSVKMLKDNGLADAWDTDNRLAISSAVYWLEKIYESNSVVLAYRCRKIYDSVNIIMRRDATEEAKAITDFEQTKADEERKAKEKRRRHNYQYIGITILLAVTFIALSLMGFIRISTTVIRILGFFSFILLFEFIILIADGIIHTLTHGEPWKILAVKIVLAAMLVPLHHYLEKKVIRYLMGRQLIGTNNNPGPAK